MKLNPGSRWRSTVCDTEVIVVRGTDDDVDLRCGGQPMVGQGEEPPGGLVLDAALAEGTALGKRYTDETGDVELLCTKAGDGSLSLGDAALGLKDAKPLPSSD